MRGAIRPSTVARVALGVAGRPRPAPGAVVLGYHDVRPDITDRFDVTPDQLRGHLERLTGMYQVVQFGELVDRLLTGLPLDGLACVTFDDALDGLLRHGADVLAAAGVPATVFVVSGSGGVEPPWWPGPRRTLDASELRELQSGGIEVGARTRSHADLVLLDDDSLDAELLGCRVDLEPIVGGPVDLLAYPRGHADAHVRAAAVRAGYRASCTFTNGRVHRDTDPMAIPRLTMDARHGSLRFAAHLARSSASWPPPPPWAVTTPTA